MQVVGVFTFLVECVVTRRWKYELLTASAVSAVCGQLCTISFAAAFPLFGAQMYNRESRHAGVGAEAGRTWLPVGSKRTGLHWPRHGAVNRPRRAVCVAFPISSSCTARSSGARAGLPRPDQTLDGDQRSGQGYGRGKAAREKQTIIFIALVARQTDRCVRDAGRGIQWTGHTWESAHVREPEGRQRDWMIMALCLCFAGHVPVVSQGSEGAAGLTTSWVMRRTWRRRAAWKQARI